MQLRILRLDLLQDRNIPVGIFPEPEEVFLYTASARMRAASASAPCEVLDCKALARATPRRANAPMGSF